MACSTGRRTSVHTHPVSTIPNANTKKAKTHHVDALERQIRGLVQEEVHDHRTGEVARREDEPVAELDRADDERREEREEEVPQPVGRGCERGLACARARWERLADQDPDAPARVQEGSQ